MTVSLAPDSLRLRPLALADAPVLARLLHANRSFLAPTSPLRTDDYFSDAGQERTIRASLEAAERGEIAPMVLVVHGEVVGTLNLNSIIRGAFQSASIGYWVSRERNGEGIASRAVALAKVVAADQLALHRLQAETLVDNVASQKVLVRNGLVRYGTAPDYLKIAGRWQEHALFQVTFPQR